MNTPTDDDKQTPRLIEVVVLERGREIASAVQREDGAPSFRGSPLLPEETKELARVLLAGSAEGGK